MMEFPVLAFLFFLIVMSLVALIVIPTVRKHQKVTGNVSNYDVFLRRFVYKVPMSREEIIRTLNIKNGMDDLFCTVDVERSVLLLSDDILNMEIEYSFEIQECEGFSILRLDQGTWLTRNQFWYKMNPFFVSKIHAEIIPFSQYGV